MPQPVHFHFDVDLAHNRKYDEYYRDPKQLQASSIGLGLLLIALGAAGVYFLKSSPASYLFLVAFTVVGLVFFAIAAVIPKKVGTPQTVYDLYPLAPAVITHVVEPSTKTNNNYQITIVGLVDAATDPDSGAITALATRTVKALPGHTVEVGQRIPVVAVPGRRAVVKNRQHWADMTLIPICWGTSDKGVIADATAKVPQALWRKLKKYSPRYPEITKQKTGLLVV